MLHAPKTGRCRSGLHTYRSHIDRMSLLNRGQGGRGDSGRFVGGRGGRPSLPPPPPRHTPRLSHSLPPARARLARLAHPASPPCSRSALHLRPQLPTHSLPRKSPPEWRGSAASLSPAPNPSGCRLLDFGVLSGRPVLVQRRLSEACSAVFSGTAMGRAAGRQGGEHGRAGSAVGSGTGVVQLLQHSNALTAPCRNARRLSVLED